MSAAGEYDTGVMAQAYVAMGWSVFPLHWIVGGGGGAGGGGKRRCSCAAAYRCGSPGKHPLIAGGVNAASRKLATVAEWWRIWPAANIGLPAGSNGLAVLDVDPRHGGDASMVALAGGLTRRGLALPDTLTAATGGGGRHLVFIAPEGGVKGGSNVFGPDMAGLDTRGRGGYVVAAPSMHASGERYEWVNFLTKPAPWPVVLSWLMGVEAS